MDFPHWKWWFSIVMLVYQRVVFCWCFCSVLFQLLAKFGHWSIWKTSSLRSPKLPWQLRAAHRSLLVSFQIFLQWWLTSAAHGASQKEVDGGLVDFGGPETPSWESLGAVIPLISLALMERKLTLTDCCLVFFTLTNFNPHQFLPKKNKTTPLTTRAPSARGPIRWRSPGNRCSSTSEIHSRHLQVVNLY